MAILSTKSKAALLAINQRESRYTGRAQQKHFLFLPALRCGLGSRHGRVCGEGSRGPQVSA